MPVEAFEGRVLAVGTVSTGDGQYGPWKVQNVKIKDTTGETEVAFWDRDDLAYLKGQAIRVESVSTDKGVAGIKVKEKKGKKGINVDNRAIIHPLSAGVPEGMKSAHTGHHPESANVPAPTSVIPAKERIFQYAQLMIKCVGAAKYVSDQVAKNEVAILGEDHFQAIASSLFIQATREGLHNEMERHPAKPANPTTPPPPPAAEDDSDNIPI